MRIAVFEDDKDFAIWLENLIRQYTHSPTAINTDNVVELSRWIEGVSEPVLYLLDIVKNGKVAGFKLAQMIAEQCNGGLIVFITAYPQTIKDNPFLKTKVFSLIIKNGPGLEQEIKETLSLAQKAFQANCLYIYSGKSQSLYIPYDSICYIEAVKGTNKLCIHCMDGQYIIRGTLQSIQQQLAPFGFVRCHKSILANKANIRKRDKPNMILTFSSGATCPYSYLMRGGLDGIQ